MTDRWFLADFSGVVAVGVYSLHLKTAAIVAQAIVIPFGLWFPPERFKHIGDPDRGHAFFKKTAIAVALVCAYVSGCVWLARDIVLPLIAPGIVASPLVLACCLGGVTCLALSHAFNVGLLQPGHTAKNAWCMLYAVAATVVAAAVLVPVFGMEGAAASRLTGGAVLVAVTAMYSYRVAPIAFPFIRIAACFAFAIAAARVIDPIEPARDVWHVSAILIEWSVAMGCIAPVLWLRIPGRGYLLNQAPPSPS